MLNASGYKLFRQRKGWVGDNPVTVYQWRCQEVIAGGNIGGCDLIPVCPQNVHHLIFPGGTLPNPCAHGQFQEGDQRLRNIPWCGVVVRLHPAIFAASSDYSGRVEVTHCQVNPFPYNRSDDPGATGRRWRRYLPGCVLAPTPATPWPF